MGRFPSLFLLLVVCLAFAAMEEEVHSHNVLYPLKARQFAFPRKKGIIHHAASNIDSTSSSSPSSSPSTPDSFFEAERPIEMPPTSTYICSSSLLLSHTFADTTGSSSPVTSRYVNCTRQFDKVVLRWAGACSGRQFGRIATVWLGGAEILRSCTPEFSDSGGAWAFTKDVTRFTALLKKPRRVGVELGNVLDIVYSGAYNINLTLDFYLTGLKRQFSSPDPTSAPSHQIKPISLPYPSNGGGYWYSLGGSNPQSVSTQLSNLPRNAYRAVLEVCVSFHGDDESWYTNPPDDYAQANNLTFGNGPFREISAFLDGQFVGAIWPFPVIYTGAFNPLAWRPALPIGTTSLPSYDLEITPFLSYLIDGKTHTITLTVSDALSTWLVDANLHLWVDHKLSFTSASLLSYNVPTYLPTDKSQFSGVDGQFIVSAARNYSFSGSVTSSQGKITTCVTSCLQYNNTLVIEDDYGYQTADLLITSKTQVLSTTDSFITSSYQKSTEYPLKIDCLQADAPSNSTYLNCTIFHAMNSNEFALFPKGTFARVLKNSQNAGGELTVAQDNTVSGGSGSLQQQYDYKSTKGCYQRYVSTSNDAILSDLSSTTCTACS